MNVRGHDIAVCSWSLRPKGMADLIALVRQAGLSHVQLALMDLLFLDDKQKYQELGHLRAAGLALTGGMIGFRGEDYSTIDSIRRTGGFVPDDEWPLRRKLSAQAARLATELGLESVTTHVGFVPPRSDPAYPRIAERVREVAAGFAAQNVDLLMETGQEPAGELLEFLEDLSAPNVHINFDPANMILYGAGDPIAAVRALGQHIRHVHVKDAVASARPGVEWGEEVPFGTGRVGVKAFLGALDDVGYAGPLAIEREAGDTRLDDVRVAVEALRAAG